MAVLGCYAAVHGKLFPLAQPVTVYAGDASYLVHADRTIGATTSLPIAEQNALRSVAALYDLERNDPLLYSPGLNQMQWHKTISVLKTEREQFFAAMKLYPAKDRPEQEVNNLILADPESVFPLEFLDMLPKVAQAHETFLAHPSKENAETLLDAEARAATLYAASADGFARITSVAQQTFRPAIYLNLGSALSIRLIDQDAHTILKNAQKLLSDVDARKQCLISGACDISYSDVSLPPASTETVPQPPYKIPISLITPPRSQNLGLFGVSTSCYGTTDDKPRMWPMYLFESAFEGVPTILPVLANENFYWDVRESSFRSETERAAMGITYDDQIPTNFYMCNDSQYYVSALTLLYLRDLVRKEGAIVPAENQLEEGIPSDALFPELLRSYAQLNTASSTQRAQIIENRMVSFELVLGKMVEMMHVYGDLTTINETPFPAVTLLGLRDSYSLLYMPFARSVWRINARPDFLLKGTYDNSSRFFSWDEVHQRIDVAKAHVWDTDVIAQILIKIGKGNWRAGIK